MGVKICMCGCNINNDNIRAAKRPLKNTTELTLLAEQQRADLEADLQQERDEIAREKEKARVEREKSMHPFFNFIFTRLLTL